MPGSRDRVLACGKCFLSEALALRGYGWGRRWITLFISIDQVLHSMFPRPYEAKLGNPTHEMNLKDKLNHMKNDT